jgi:hypothetical protein
MLRTYSCTDVEVLRRFHKGRLTPADASTVESHLLTCPACVQLLRKVQAEDHLSEVLARQTRIPEPTPQDKTDAAALIERVRLFVFRRLHAPACPVSRPEAETTVDLPAQAKDRETGPVAIRGDTGAAAEASSLAPADSAFAFLRPAEQADELGRLGTLRVLKLLGEGGMGYVFAAEDELAQRQVAVKVMKRAIDRAACDRFLREARAAAALTHDHVVPIYQVGQDDDLFFLVMPLLKGETLEAFVHANPRPPLAFLLQVGRQVAEGLAAAHHAGLVHRDIKPSNVWLEEVPGQGLMSRPRVKILDFGLARPLQEEGLTQSGTLLGTPGYMSPEQINGEPLDSRGDLFSLGCVLYQVATGQRPFQGKNLTSLLRAACEQEPAAPDTLNTEIPAELSALIVRLLAKLPQERPASAQAVAESLLALEVRLAGQDANPLPSEAQGASVQARPRGTPVRTVAAIVVVVAVLLAAGAYWLIRGSGTPLHSEEGPAIPPSSAVPLKGELVVSVKKKGSGPWRHLHDPGVLPLRAGDAMHIEGEANRLAYFYVVYLESSGRVSPLYPWKEFQWDTRAPEEARRHLRLPDDALTDSPSGIEAILLLTRDTVLPAAENDELSRGFASWPRGRQADALRGVVWLDKAEPPRFSSAIDRGRPEAAPMADGDDPVLHARRLLQAVRPLFADTQGVCYSFQGDKP